MNLSGSCLCGAVTYACSSPAVLSGNCHCLDCKKASGSGYVPVFFVAENAITIRGEVKWYEHAGASGKPVRRGFCPHCGSQMFGKPAAMPKLIGVRAGSLDDPAQYEPQVDIYTSRAPTWDCMDPALPKFAEMPPMQEPVQQGVPKTD
ncbi:MAG: GFA family protein [Rhodanobacter sp.]|jgi:hypothetical protein|nr:GFA family protein [Rhodanobacter sp.]